MLIGEVPLSVNACRVAAGLKHLGQRFLLVADSVRCGRPQGAQNADTIRVAPCEQCSSRCRANRLGYVEVGEAHSFPGHAVEIRGFYALVAKPAQIPVLYGMID